MLFVVDGQDGATPLDLELADRLRRSCRPAILVVNKVDAPEHDDFPADFARLGFPQTLGVSAAHGRSIAELVETIEDLLPPAPGRLRAAGSTKTGVCGPAERGKIVFG